MSASRVIELTKGFVAIIDAEDYRKVNRYSWHTHLSAGTGRRPGQPYARATVKGKKVFLHRFVTDAPEETHVDHRNHQALDCRKINLKITSPLENQQNKRKRRERPTYYAPLN